MNTLYDVMIHLNLNLIPSRSFVKIDFNAPKKNCTETKLYIFTFTIKTINKSLYLLNFLNLTMSTEQITNLILYSKDTKI